MKTTRNLMLSQSSDVNNELWIIEFCLLLTVSFDIATLQTALQNFKKKCFRIAGNYVFIFFHILSPQMSYLGGFEKLEPLSSSLNN